MQDWKMRGQKCMVGKRGTGKRGTKLQNWKTWEKLHMESQMVYFT